ncbi:hypothetical protein [Rhodococcoides yunnanense]|uniref:hypothetical protein n=1 Tax=Rhodococcoides yunnanense TaxID=278209 RepID=UPI00093551A1|nr:hypothetical protein [Rhodococcus yunnanensis]
MQTGKSHDAVVRALIAACRHGDPRSLRRLLADGVTAVVDGKGEVTGREEVAQLLLGASAAHPAANTSEKSVSEESVSEESVNGRVGLAFRSAGHVRGVVSFAVEDGAIDRVWIVSTADKLRHWTPPNGNP